jgi:hypothetical protein
MRIRWPKAAPISGPAPRSGRIDSPPTWGRALILVAVLTVFSMIGPSARAGSWVVFFVPGTNGQTALVAENVNNNLNGTWSYTFAVANITNSTNPLAAQPYINGFFFGVGPAAAALGGGIQYASVAGGGDATFPNAIPPLPANPQPLWNTSSWVGTAVGPNIGPTWGFEEFDDRPGGAGANFPNTAYIMRWYNPNQGGNAVDLQAETLAAALLFGPQAYFQITSNFGPVPGYGGVDPFSGGSLGFTDSGSLGPFTLPDVYPGGDITSGSSPPSVSVAFAGIPEPSSMISGSTALIVLSFVGWVRRRTRRAA